MTIKTMNPTQFTNAREKLRAVEYWLGDQDESLSFVL